MSGAVRILHCLRAPVGGLFRHVLDLAGEQAARGHEVGIIADSNSGDRLTREKLAQIEPRLALGLHLVPMSRYPGLGDAGPAFKTLGIAKRTQARVLHGHGAKGGAFARIAGAMLKAGGEPVRCYYTPHGGSLHFDPAQLQGRIYLGLESLLGRVTDGIIFESDYSRRIYEARIGIGVTPTRVVPNGLGEADFALAEPAADAADFLFVGELRHLKGVDALLEALAMLGRQRPVRAVIVGDGPDAAQFRALAANLDLGARVHFAGAMPARQAFALGRCLVLPSRAESFPYIVLEAAAAGLPLVASRVGGIPEIVDGADPGLVPPGDAAALAAAMARVLDDPAAAARGARTLREAVARKFTVDAMTTAILNFQSEPLPTGGVRLELTKT